MTDMWKLALVAPSLSIVTPHPSAPLTPLIFTNESSRKSRVPAVDLKKPPPSGCFPAGQSAVAVPSAPAATATVGPETRW
jgi:hypothetical protein